MSLQRLQGTWDLTMHHSAFDQPVLGSQRYAETLDGRFLELTWTYEHPDFPDARAILDQANYHYFDVRGTIRVFDFRLDDAGWDAVLLEPEFSQRMTARFAGEDRIDVVGDLSRDEGATWVHDFEMTLRRVD